MSVALTPDGKWALTGSSHITARLWEIIPRMPLAKVQEIIGHMKKAPEVIDLFRNFYNCGKFSSEAVFLQPSLRRYHEVGACKGLV